MLLGEDYRDRYRPGGGRSRLTIRRLLLLVDALRDDGRSQFWAAVLDRDTITTSERLLADVFYALTEHKHPLLTRREDQQELIEREKRKKQIKASERKRRRRVAMARNQQMVRKTQ